MHKIYITLIILSGSFICAAQSLSLNNTMNVVTGSVSVTEDVEIDSHWDVINSSSIVLSVRAKRNIISETAGSRNRFCWGPICYDYPVNESSTNSNLIVTMEPEIVNQTFHGYYEHQGYEGCTTIEYCFFDHNNEADEVCQTVTFAVDCVVDIAEPLITEVSLSDFAPNPAVGLSSLTYSFNSVPSAARLIIYNLVGKAVREIAIEESKGIIIINGSEFENGVYFYTLESNGKVHCTKKLVVNR